MGLIALPDLIRMGGNKKDRGRGGGQRGGWVIVGAETKNNHIVSRSLYLDFKYVAVSVPFLLFLSFFSIFFVLNFDSDHF